MKNEDFADPFVLRYNGRYYLYCTTPMVDCYSSADLVNWKKEGPSVPKEEFPGLVPFAPEVVYWNGFFYMYTSPHGYGHYVLQSERPTGPFRKITDNLHHNIDFSVFVDEDGKWYAYWADDAGILGCEMKSPTEFGETVEVGASLHGWTEGPFVVKREGKYHLTYTGNHFLSKGYRINTAIADSPLGPFQDVGDNPQVIRTKGALVGLGHSSTIVGPDLQTDYLIYHNLNPDRTRNLCMDRIIMKKETIQVCGPTDYPQPVPSFPDVYDTPEDGNGWVVEEGTLIPMEEFYHSETALACHYGKSFPEKGRLELHFRVGADTNCYRIKLQGEQKSLTLVFDRSASSISLQDEDKSIWSKSLPEGYCHEALHRVLVDTNERPMIFLDQLLLPGGGMLSGDYKVSVESDGGVELGTTIYAKKASESICYPVPSRVIDGSAFLLNVKRNGEYVIVIPRETKMSLLVDDRPVPEDRVVCRHGVTRVVLWIQEGIHEIKTKEDSCSGLHVYERENFAEEELEVKEFGPYDKCHGAFPTDDIRITAQFQVQTIGPEGQYGILFRGTQLADGGEGEDRILGTNFMIGYRACVCGQEICLYKHRYDETLLAKANLVKDKTGTLSVSAIGREISIFLGEKEVIQYKDPEPILYGYSGVHTRNCVITKGRIVTSKPSF